MIQNQSPEAMAYRYRCRSARQGAGKLTAAKRVAYSERMLQNLYFVAITP